MKIELQIEGKAPDPHLGIVNGYIQEGINQVSLMELVTISNIELTEADVENMIGKPVTLKLKEPIQGEYLFSRFDGVIYEFHEMDPYAVQRDSYLYRIIIRPQIWGMHIGNNARSFRDKSRIEVIQEVLEGWGLQKGTGFDSKHFKESVYQKLDQILQCEMSDWAFLLQLFQEAGINYCFIAPKDDSKSEMLYLIDHEALFPKGYQAVIPWNPSREITSSRAILSFETHVRTVPKKVDITATLGDGMVNVFTNSRDVQGGKGGDYRYFCAGGQMEEIAKNTATVIAESFESRRLEYRGKSNHFLIRSGEKIEIEHKRASRQWNLLVTAVRHEFRQTVSGALEGGGSPLYTNMFSGIREKTPIRPTMHFCAVDAREGSTLPMPLELRQSEQEDSTTPHRETASPFSSASASSLLAMPVMEDRMTALTRQLAKVQNEASTAGIMLGKVTKDTWTTDGKEMVCQIENERFPDGLIVKVSAPWLSTGGGIAAFPREGQQIYFLHVQGAGGHHEGVIIGYRSTAETPGLNPGKTTTMKKLKAGPKPELDKPAQPVVESEEIAPSNRQRNALAGEAGAAEMAVIDGDAPSVSMSAKGALLLSTEGDSNITCKNHMHIADVATEQFGERTLGVSGDSTEAIGGNVQQSIMGNQDAFIAGNQAFTISGNAEQSISGNKTVTVSGNFEASVSGTGSVSVTGDMTESMAANKTESIGGDKELSCTNYTQSASSNSSINAGSTLELNGTTVAVSASGEVTISGTSKIELACAGSSVTIDPTGIVMSGPKIDVSGQAMVTIAGAMVKIN